MSIMPVLPLAYKYVCFPFSVPPSRRHGHCLSSSQSGEQSILGCCDPRLWRLHPRSNHQQRQLSAEAGAQLQHWWQQRIARRWTMQSQPGKNSLPKSRLHLERGPALKKRLPWNVAVPWSAPRRSEQCRRHRR